MFRHEGEHRSGHHNQLLAGYLAFVAGCVNSEGFILLGTFTSHVTGNVGRFADDLALGGHARALLAATMIIAFFVGAFVASMALESNVFTKRPHVYGALLFGEAALLGLFFALSIGMDTVDRRLLDSQALLLCAAMGLQNSLVTRLSGAVVRTTHLTGVVTDLGIEGARWFRYWRAQVSERVRLRLTLGSKPPARPHGPKSALLAVILGAFVLGSAVGALLAVELGRAALLVPLGMLVVGGVVAFVNGFEPVGEDVRK